MKNEVESFNHRMRRKAEAENYKLKEELENDDKWINWLMIVVFCLTTTIIFLILKK
jgi:hypothetical protein